jgi:hypothetical protein
LDCRERFGVFVSALENCVSRRRRLALVEIWFERCISGTESQAFRAASTTRQGKSVRPKYAANDRMQGTADENKATAQGTITYFGTYTVSADRMISIEIIGSSFPN